MDPYHQTSHIPPLQNTSGISNISGHQATSNYVVQLDPNSGHFEIIDSSLVTVPSSTRTVELTGLTTVCGENDEAVYKIRDDEDFYIRPLTGDQRFPTIDIDPVMDVGDLFSRNVIQTQPDQMQQQQIQLPVQNIQFVQQLENHQLAVTPHHHNLQTHPIQAQLQIQPSQHQPQINYALEEVGGLSMPLGLESYQVQQQQQQPVTTSSLDVVGGSGQVSGTIMSIVSSFISPGATAVQVDNNLIIYDPSGQIIQIPLPTNQTSNPTSTQIQTVVPTTSISSSGYQFQTVQTSSQSVSDNSMATWVDFVPMSSSSTGSILLDTSTVSVASSSLPQQQYLSVGNNNMTTIQFPPDQREYSISTTSTEPSSEHQTSYYTMQNVELVPTASSQSVMSTNSGTTATFTPVMQEITRTNEGVSDHLSRQEGCIPAHEIASSVISNKSLQESVHANIEKPVKESTTALIQEKVESCTNSESVNVPITTTSADLSIKTASSSDPVKHQVVDNFDLKIVSCYSLSQSASQNLNKTESIDETRPAVCDERKDSNEDSPVDDSPAGSDERVENDKIDVKSSEIESANDPQSTSMPVKDACHFVKELRKLKHLVPDTNSRPAKTPKWLFGYVDDDDELLLAFKNRADPMRKRMQF